MVCKPPHQSLYQTEADRKFTIFKEKARIDFYRHKMQGQLQQFNNLKRVAKQLSMPLPTEFDLPKDIETLMRHAMSGRDLDIVDQLLPIIRQRSQRLGILVSAQQDFGAGQFKELLASGLSGTLSNQYQDLKSRVLRLGLKEEAESILNQFKHDRDFKKLQSLSESTHYTNKKGEVKEKQYS